MRIGCRQYVEAMMKTFILILVVLILLFGFIMSRSLLESEPCGRKDIVFMVSDGYSMGWACLPDSLKDGQMRIEWEDMTYFQKRGKLVVFAVYLDGPFEGRAYRPRESDRGKYIVRDGKKVYLYVLEEF